MYPFFFKIVHYYVDKTESLLTCHIFSKLLFCCQFCPQSARQRQHYFLSSIASTWLVSIWIGQINMPSSIHWLNTNGLHVRVTRSVEVRCSLKVEVCMGCGRNYGVVYGSPCGRPERVCLFILPWLALRRTGLVLKRTVVILSWVASSSF